LKKANAKLEELKAQGGTPHAVEELEDTDEEGGEEGDQVMKGTDEESGEEESGGEAATEVNDQGLAITLEEGDMQFIDAATVVDATEKTQKNKGSNKNPPKKKDASTKPTEDNPKLDAVSQVRNFLNVLLKRAGERCDSAVYILDLLSIDVKVGDLQNEKGFKRCARVLTKLMPGKTPSLLKSRKVTHSNFVSSTRMGLVFMHRMSASKQMSQQALKSYVDALVDDPAYKISTEAEFDEKFYPETGTRANKGGASKPRRNGGGVKGNKQTTSKDGKKNNTPKKNTNAEIEECDSDSVDY